MSKISEISHQYHKALSDSQRQYTALYRERSEAAGHFHKDFFNKLICRFDRYFKNERFRARVQELVEKHTGTDTLQFIAIDGTCSREVFTDLITFFGGAYGARGELSFVDGAHRIRYKRWSLDHDVSMVAWVPVPFARLEEVAPGDGEQFLVTEEEKINLSAVHIQVMQLAEIFLAYNSVISSRLDAPHILLMDLSPSSVLAAAATSQKNIGLSGYPYDRRALTPADITTGLAHPFSSVFGIPSSKKMDLHRLIIAKMHDAPDEPLDLAALADAAMVSLKDLERAADFLVKRGVLARPRIGSPQYQPKINLRESWAYTRDFYQNICSRLFLDKDPGALQYEAPDELGTLRRRWMAPDDINFLIGSACAFSLRHVGSVMSCFMGW